MQQLVAEDEQVRIAELRVRGQTQRLTVHEQTAWMLRSLLEE